MLNKIDAIRQALKLQKDASSSGGTIFSGLGLNAINLEQQAKSLIPYNAPFLASTPRVVSDVGGLTVQWKAVLSASNGWVSLPEAERNQSADLLEKDYSAPFKSQGNDVDVSFFAQETGRGFQDNVGFAQFSALQMFLRSQDQQILCDGNSGPANDGGGNGYALGTCPTPVAALISNSVVQGSIPGSTHVSGFAVLVTPSGFRYQTDGVLFNTTGAGGTTGLTPQGSATNMDGATIVHSGGISALSAGSNVVTTTSGSQTVEFSISKSGSNLQLPYGAVGFALYVDSTDVSVPSTANAVFAGLFNGSTAYITALPTGSNQKANASGLSTDYSYDNQDVDSYYAWSVNWSAQGVTPTGSYAPYQDYFVDQAGATLTAVGDSSIYEFTEAANYLYNKYKSAPDRILIASQTVSGTSLKEEIQKAVLQGGTTPAQRLNFQQGADGQVAGTLDWSYSWPYSYDGMTKNLKVEVMPWLQPGMIIFQTTQNPYPQAAGRIPAAFEVHSLLDTFSIMWPIRKLQYELGVYGFLATKNYLPHVSAVIQNVG